MQNSGVAISFLLVFIQFVISFECFVFMALSLQIENLPSKNALCPWHEIPPALISACASTDRFSSMDYSSPVTGCNIGSILTSFVTFCDILPILSRNSLCLKSSYFSRQSMLDCVNFWTTTVTWKSFYRKPISYIDCIPEFCFW